MNKTTPSRAARAPQSTARYVRKKAAIFAAATEILNTRGVKGLTFAEVAAKVGLITTSVTYYFRKKESLIAACFLHAIERFGQLVAGAREETEYPLRWARFLSLFLDLSRRTRLGEEPALAKFNEIRALPPANSAVVIDAYADMFRKVRSLFDTPQLAWLDRRGRNARTHLLMEQLLWSAAWLKRYDPDDYRRIGERMLDVLNNGLAVTPSRWAPLRLPELEPTTSPSEMSRETFLVAATELINEQGYRGASIDKISARLHVTKGSFYHHHDTKNDLVVACFERSFELIHRAQRMAAQRADSGWDQLCTASAALIDHQLSRNAPLLRNSAVSALPESISHDIIARSHAIADRFAAFISDGIADGSVRPVDPLITSQMITAAINASAELRRWVKDVTPQEALELYLQPLLYGLFSTRPPPIATV